MKEAGIMKHYSRKEINDNLDYLKLLSNQYRNMPQVTARIVELNSGLNLPKGTEHFITDIHGENEAFEHVLRNCSGSIRRKSMEALGDSMDEKDFNSLMTLIYYPKKKLALLEEQGVLTDSWYKKTLKTLIEVLARVSGKYSRSDVRKNLDRDYADIIAELLFVNEKDGKKTMYIESIYDTIIDVGLAKDFIIKICRSIRHINLEHLHIIGDIYDRGRGAHLAMEIINNFPSVDIQWGNHDITWMGANQGSLVCMATVARICLRYGNIETLRSGYGIGVLALSLFADRVYSDSTEEDLKPFMPRLSDETPVIAPVLLAKMQKAMAIIQFKLESQAIKRHPEYRMENRDLLSKCDFRKGTVTVDGKEYPLNTRDFPTIDPDDPTRLSKDEEEIMALFKKSFTNSEKLTEHVNTLINKGSIYLVYNGNLMFHGCIPLDEDGSFKPVRVGDGYYRGKQLLDKMEEHIKNVIADDNDDKSYFWYLWCGPDSPLFGKDKMATFERYFIDDKSVHKETYQHYFTKAKEEPVAEMILREFGLTNPHSKIINGHVPIKVRIGQTPVQANGRLLLIDGGYSRAYREVTGIAGFTLTYNSYGMNLIAHHPFSDVDYAVKHEIDIRSEKRFLYDENLRVLVRDTDRTKSIHKEINYLKMLLCAYRNNIIKEKDIR